MCGRYTLKTSPQQLMSLFQVPVLPEFGPRYNIAPTQQVLVFRAAAVAERGQLPSVTDATDGRSGGARLATLMRWGLVPSWAKDLSVGSQMINARSETAAEKPAFRSAFVRRRCLIPADGFYEWQKLTDGRKQPWWIHPADGGVLALAGLWELWSGGAEGAPVVTCTILTTAAGPDVQGLHDRMPVILAPETWDLWLSVSASKPQLQSLMRPLPAGSLQLQRVSTLVNRATVDNPDCLQPDGDLFGDQRL